MGVNISRAKAQLKRSEPTEDNVICLVVSGVAVAGKIALSEPKQIFGTDALVTLGITEGNNPLAYKDITDFYAKVGEGAELNIMLVVDTTSLTDISDKALNIGKKLIESTEGRGVILLINRKLPAGYVSAKTNGFESDVWTAVAKLQEMAIDFQAQNIPFVAALPGLGFTSASIAAIPARSTLTNDFVALNCYCEKNDGLVSMGIFAAWTAKHQVHENVGRVASGKVTDTAFMPDGTACKDLKNSWAALAAKGLIFPVKIGGKSGYFFNDDPMLTAISSDYSSWSWNRVINKAQRIAYDILIEKLNDDVETNETTGLIETTLASDWESDVENAIKAQMMKASPTRKKEISGIKCTVDPESDVINDQVSASINIVRKGQAKIINVKIGYTQTL
jgi:hypothetical protein